jgi:hypothetical protein
MTDEHTPKPPRKSSPSTLHRIAMHAAFDSWLKVPNEQSAKALAAKMQMHEIKMRLTGTGGSYRIGTEQ